MRPGYWWPSAEARLDGTDPLGGNSVIRRPHLAKAINDVAGLQPSDPLGELDGFISSKYRDALEAWGRNQNHNGEDHTGGERLVCNRHFLKALLAQLGDRELLLLLVLRRYAKSSGNRGSQYWHTTGIVRLRKSLDFEFYPGPVNKLHEINY